MHTNIKTRRLSLLVAVIPAALLAATLGSTSPADAAAYPISVNAPTKINATQAQGRANLSRDCSGTLGCFNYIKLERSTFWGPVFVNGWWANANGWNSITGTLNPGCYNYRTTTDSYNDVAGSWSAGVNIGQVGVTAGGTKIYRYRTTWSSGWVRICR